MSAAVLFATLVECGLRSVNARKVRSRILGEHR
jgi:hypothetical protein